ncbi:hypothetical protein GL218_07558 [Daldinia childiae]|uniref:uncharacterized protein n=1 Tax=Daldinia childiae TaxID=326645 RepID=UPI0014454121|nr:uncharacterized protein GL218_07558 [Daldinia childiae]KAF3055194.1 hypothetical protein GL218_07558 [Daldinia childiae]
MSEALEESLRVATEAIQKEADRDQEVSVLREKLRIANSSTSDERNLSHMVSQQVEGLERLIGIQHNEMKQYKSEIEDLKQVNKILTEENDHLHVDSSSIQMTSVGTQTDYYLDKTTSAVVSRLEEQIVISREQNQKLLAELQQENGQQAKLENNPSSEWHQATSQTIHEYQRNEYMANTDQELATRMSQLDTNDRKTPGNPTIGYQYMGSAGPLLTAEQYKPLYRPLYTSMCVQTRELGEKQEIQETETTQEMQMEEGMVQFKMNMFR